MSSKRSVEAVQLQWAWHGSLARAYWVCWGLLALQQFAQLLAKQLLIQKTLYKHAPATHEKPCHVLFVVLAKLESLGGWHYVQYNAH